MLTLFYDRFIFGGSDSNYISVLIPPPRHINFLVPVFPGRHRFGTNVERLPRRLFIGITLTIAGLKLLGHPAAGLAGCIYRQQSFDRSDLFYREPVYGVRFP